MYVPEKTVAAFVSYGEQAKMYTLRVLTEGYNYMGTQKSRQRHDYYVQNLSTKRDLAIAKARAYADDKGLKYLDSDAANRELYEIKRRAHEEVQRQLLEQAEQNERQRQEHYEQVKEEAEKLGVDVMVFGKYHGSRIMDVIESNPEYIDYILSANIQQLPIEYPRNVYEYCLNTIYNIVKENNITLIQPSVSEHVGSKGDKITLEVSVKRKVLLDGYYGTTSLYVFEDLDGNVFTTYYSGSKWKASIGDVGTLSGTIKGHDEYKEVKQTVLTRAKFTVSEEDEQQED